MRPRRILAAVSSVLAACVLAAGAPAHAATATFVSPVAMDPASRQALSRQGDGAGFFVGLSETLALLFSTPFAAVKNADAISIFTLAPAAGTARFTISIGIYNNGAPIFVTSNIVNAGNSVTVANLFQQGCGVFAGCDYIEITTTRTTRGAAGASVDYVSVNGEVVEIAAPAPEPGVWALMILGFAGVAARLKSLRRQGGAPPAPA